MSFMRWPFPTFFAEEADGLGVYVPRTFHCVRPCARSDHRSAARRRGVWYVIRATPCYVRVQLTVFLVSVAARIDVRKCMMRPSI